MPAQHLQRHVDPRRASHWVPLDHDLWQRQQRRAKYKTYAIAVPLTWMISAATWTAGWYVSLLVGFVAGALISATLHRRFMPKRIPHVGECTRCHEVRCRCPN